MKITGMAGLLLAFMSPADPAETGVLFLSPSGEVVSVADTAGNAC